MNSFLNFLDALADQDVIAWYKLFGAIWTVIAGLTFLALTVYLIQIQIRANRWERLVRVCGSEKSALKVLETAETLPVDRLIGMGMKSAQEKGWL
jgi:hypothetical protein